MSKYVFVYHGGGGAPQSPEEGQALMAKWHAWFESMGSAVVDGGNPVGQSHTVSAEGVVDNGGSNPISGYSLISADTLEEALVLAKNCPILESGGTIEVAEAMEM